MTATNQNFTVYSGDTESVVVGVSQDGSAASLSSASAVWIMEEEVGSGSLARLTSDDYLSLSGSTVTIALAASHTNGLVGKYYHELEITDISSNITTVTTGIVTVKKSGASL